MPDKKMLRLNLLDRPEVHELIIPALEDRLYQEEIWAQTVWPADEESLTEHIVDNLGDFQDQVLVTVREMAGVDRLGWETP